MSTHNLNPSVAATHQAPGTSRVLDPSSGQLVPCTPQVCPLATPEVHPQHDAWGPGAAEQTAGGSRSHPQTFINRAVYTALSVWSVNAFSGTVEQLQMYSVSPMYLGPMYLTHLYSGSKFTLRVSKPRSHFRSCSTPYAVHSFHQLTSFLVQLFL